MSDKTLWIVLTTVIIVVIFITICVVKSDNDFYKKCTQEGGIVLQSGKSGRLFCLDKSVMLFRQ
jgi:uncharacterized membrane protein YqiK